MLSSDQVSQNNRGIDRSRIAAIALIQLVVLLAISGAAIFYLDWSSGVAQAEFMRAMEPSMTVRPPQSPAPVQSVKARAACPRKT
jgi:flagellar basal body-associated protein FliL